ncbi:brevican core protein triforce isoform X2 [Arctopsyche grandis]|uniref:brevican core protein triforce isoform X2 n=2 Tax=Arctopsyche grandis TaxID=121162 RepID=UPI00406D7223
MVRKSNFVNLPSLLMASLVLLASAQRTTHTKEAERMELARQNRITQEILEHYLQKRLFPQLARTRPPSLEDILPQPASRGPEDPEGESLQSVESEQVSSVYQEDCPHCEDEAATTLGINRWTMPLLKLGEKRYYLGIFFKANWFKAAQYCRFHGMHLASISSQEENDKLEKYVRDSGYGNEHFWTSGTDLAEEGNFFWMSSGRPITFTNWNAGEPNNFRYENGEEENCLELWNRDGKGLKWNDSPCSFETFFVCEVRND